MQKLTDVQIDMALALEAKATPGPWFEQYDHDVERTFCTLRSTDAQIIAIARNILRPALEELRELRKDRWTCFHCGFETGDQAEAAAHFGDRDEERPLCLTWQDLDADGRASEIESGTQI